MAMSVSIPLFHSISTRIPLQFHTMGTFKHKMIRGPEKLAMLDFQDKRQLGVKSFRCVVFQHG